VEASGIHYLELILILLLVFVVGFGSLARRLRTPYPIILVITGLLVSLLPAMPNISLNPDIVFLGFLPPLLFAAAFTTSWRDFKYNLVSICFLAFGLVGFTVFGVAAAARWILPGFDWRTGLVLGAVVATTDAIAATSIGKNLGLPKRIIDVLEGESLINDASGLLALEFTVALVVSGNRPSVAEGAGRLLYLLFGGIAVGLIIGKIVYWFESYIDDAPIEITVSIITPFMAYLAAESLHSSGVLATVACGLYLGRQSATYFSSQSRIEADAVWNTLTFVLNGIVFILIGLQLPIILASIKAYAFHNLILRAAIMTALVIALRLAWIYPGAHVSYFIRNKLLGQNEPIPSPRAIFVVGWTGMRGVVALAAAISLPEVLDNGSSFPQRSVILFMTFCVIFVTLVVQGLTLPALIRRLGLAGVPSDNSEEEEARRAMILAALKDLEAREAKANPELRPIYEDLAMHYQRRLASLSSQDKRGEGEISPQQYRTYRDVAQELRKIEYATAIELRNRNKINDEVLRTLQRELDLSEARAGDS